MDHDLKKNVFRSLIHNLGMKKIIAILLLTFYICFNAGLIVHLHYCSEVFQQLTVLVEAENCCGNDCSCCQNSTYELTASEDYDNERSYTFMGAKFSDVVQENSGFSLTVSPVLYQTVRAVNSGPLIHSSKLPIYLANEAFLI
jgi:hypothetical protein